jgi:hypothetical protein
MTRSSASVTDTGTPAPVKRSTLTLRRNPAHNHVPGSRALHRHEHEYGKVTFRNRVTAPQPILNLHAAG